MVLSLDTRHVIPLVDRGHLIALVISLLRIPMLHPVACIVTALRRRPTVQPERPHDIREMPMLSQSTAECRRVGVSPVTVLELGLEIAVELCPCGWWCARVFHLSASSLVVAFETAHERATFVRVFVPVLLGGIVVVPESNLGA
jgi:hypothetical protein